MHKTRVHPVESLRETYVQLRNVVLKQGLAKAAMGIKYRLVRSLCATRTQSYTQENPVFNREVSYFLHSIHRTNNMHSKGNIL